MCPLCSYGWVLITHDCEAADEVAIPQHQMITKVKYFSSGSISNLIYMEMATYHTGGVFSYLPHHLDLALENSVGHSAGLSWG